MYLSVKGQLKPHLGRFGVKRVRFRLKITLISLVLHVNYNLALIKSILLDYSHSFDSSSQNRTPNHLQTFPKYFQVKIKTNPSDRTQFGARNHDLEAKRCYR